MSKLRSPFPTNPTRRSSRDARDLVAKSCRWLAVYVLVPCCAVLAAEAGVFASAPPKPYTPVKASPSAFLCLGRKTELGSLLLPTQITSAGQPLLAGPIRIVTEPDFLAGAIGKSRVTERGGDRATWDWTGESQGFRIHARMTGECDGFCWYEIELAPKQPLKLSSLRLEIPRPAAATRYLHTANFTWSHFSQGLAESGGKWADKFTPYVWLGDEERGLAWCAESDQGWLLQEPKRAVEVATQGDVVVFRANVLDHEATISAPVTLCFGLQASPVKPVSFAWRAKARILHGITYEAFQPGTEATLGRGWYSHGLTNYPVNAALEQRTLLDALKDGGVKTVVFHQYWTDYFGQVTPTDPLQLRRLISECHQRGLKLLVYIGYGVARNAPELKGHHDEWSAMPLIPWTTPNRTEFEAFDATCARSGWADWLAKGIDRLFSEYELDGLYFDGTTEAWRCQNHAHGCGWQDEAGNVHADYPILAVRQMMRRIADAVHRHRPDAILDAHMSASLSLPTLAFCDSYWNGEQFEGYTAGDKFNLPLHAFRTEFMGYAHGLDAEFLCYENRPFTLDEAIALAWVHGVEVRPFPATLPKVSLIWRAMDRFGTTSAEWLPYWKGSGATGEDESVKVSAYVKPGSALLWISHLSRERGSTMIRLDRRRLGLTKGALSAVDALSGTEVALEDDTLPLTFGGMTFRLIELRDQRHR